MSSVGRPVIKLNLYSIFCINPREYEQMKREVEARVLAGDVTIVERFIAHVLVDNVCRYHELKNRADAMPHDVVLRGPDGITHRAFMSGWPSTYDTICDDPADTVVSPDTLVTCLNCIADTPE